MAWYDVRDLPGYLKSSAQWLGDAAGVTDYEGDRRRKAMRQREEGRNRQRAEMVAELLEQGRAGSQQMYQTRSREIGEKFRGIGNQQLRNASARGAVLGGGPAAKARDRGREMDRALDQASGASQNYLLQALMGGGQLQEVGFGRAGNFDAMMEQLMMASDKDLGDYLELFKILKELGGEFGAGSA